MFYCCTVSFVSSFYAIIDAAFFRFLSSLRREVASLTGAVLLLIGWGFQIGFWTNCEEFGWDDGGRGPYCPQYAMRMTNKPARKDPEGPLQNAKLAFGWILFFGYLAYMTFIAITVSKARKHEIQQTARDSKQPA